MNLRQDLLSFSGLLILAALLFAALDIADQYDKLPPRVASHFDIQGRADGWVSKREFVSLMAATMGIMVVSLVPITLLILRASPALINLPNKQYWLAPERQAETRRFMARWLLSFMAATLWFIVLLFHDSLAANFRQPPRLEWIWWMFGGYMVVVVFLMVRLFARFRRVVEAEEGEVKSKP